MSRTRLLVLVSLITLSVLLLAQCADCSYYLLQNEYIWAKLGIADVLDVTPPIKPVPARFSVGANMGDPDNPDDDGFADPGPGFEGPTSSFFDDGRMCFEDRGHPEGMFGTAMLRIADLGKEIIIGDDTQGGWVYSPYDPIYPQQVLAQWRVTLGNATDGTILVMIKFDLRRDQCRMEWAIKNLDSVPHQVGMRMICDNYSKTTDFVSGIAPGYGTVDLETDFLGKSAPEYMDFIDSFDSPTLWARHIVKPQNGMYASDATPPDRAVMGDWFGLAGTLWDYTIRPERAVTDRASSFWWNPTNLNPNQTRTIVSYYGVGVATSDLRAPYVLSVQAPRTMQYDDSQTVGLAPDPLTIKAYFYNYLISKSTGKGIDVRNVTFYCSLPTGLAFADGETPAKNLTSIGALQEGQVEWQVVPTGEAAGDLVYSVTASGNGVTSKTVRRSICVPQTQRVQFTSGLQMISMPFEFADPDPLTAMGIFDGSVTLYRYDSGANTYYTVDTLVPGEAFWMRSLFQQEVSLVEATPLAGDATYQIPLYTGWNQIGNPYVYNIQYARVQVLNEGSSINVPVSIDEASQRGWVRPTLYWYDTFTKAYASSSSKTTQLLPCRGYWIKALVPCKLMIPPVDQFGADIITGLSGGGGGGFTPVVDPEPAPVEGGSQAESRLHWQSTFN